MKQHPSDSIWQRLTAAARKAPDDRVTAAPYGFSTRVAALAMRQPAVSALSFALDRLSLRALVLSCVIMTIGIVSSYSIYAVGTTDEDPATQDLVSEIISQS
jgi:hypothetical protein